MNYKIGNHLACCRSQKQKQSKNKEVLDLQHRPIDIADAVVFATSCWKITTVTCATFKYEVMCKDNQLKKTSSNPYGM